MILKESLPKSVEHAFRELSGNAETQITIASDISDGGQFGERWLVATKEEVMIFSPDGGDALLSKKVALKDCAVATSGNYRQYVTIGGHNYSHIIDPRTGLPAEKLPSVTIIAMKTEDADALATAISVMGPDVGLKLIESLPETEAFLVAGTAENPIIHRSSGFNNFELK